MWQRSLLCVLRCLGVIMLFSVRGVHTEVNMAHLTLLDPEKRAQVVTIIEEATKHAEKEHKKKVWGVCEG